MYLPFPPSEVGVRCSLHLSSVPDYGAVCLRDSVIFVLVLEAASVLPHLWFFYLEPWAYRKTLKPWEERTYSSLQFAEVTSYAVFIMRNCYCLDFFPLSSMIDVHVF